MSDVKIAADGSNCGKPPYHGSFSESFRSFISMKAEFRGGQDKDDFLRSEAEIPIATDRTETSLTFVLDNTDENVAKLLRWKRRLTFDARVKETTLFVTMVHTSTTTIKIP